MSVDKKIVSALQKSKYTLNPQSTKTINFLGAEPNYYRITNSGASPLYLGVSMMPTTEFFDMKIGSATSKLFVDAYGHEQIYIYNPSMEEVNIIVTSFEADFDPSVLAMTDTGDSLIEVEMKGDTIISGFECSLPAGTNKIGGVSIEGTPTVNVGGSLANNVEVIMQDMTNNATNMMNLAFEMSALKDTFIKAEEVRNDEIYFTGKLGYIHNITGESNWDNIQIKNTDNGQYYSVSSWNDYFFTTNIKCAEADVIYEGDKDNVYIIHQPYSTIMDKITDIYNAMTEKKYPSDITETYVPSFLEDGSTLKISNLGYITDIEGMTVEQFFDAGYSMYVKVGSAEIPLTRWNTDYAFKYTDEVEVKSDYGRMIQYAKKMLTHNEKLIQLLESKT